MTTSELKDDRLDQLAEHGNVAQFASFGAGAEPVLRHHRLAGDPQLASGQPAELARQLLAQATSGTVNVRSFRPDRDKGCPFHYGIAKAGDAADLVYRLAGEGYLTIVNETIDIHDGGVSGVALAGIVEFAPDDTPRAVEQPGVASLPLAQAVRILTTVYGFAPELPDVPTDRLEFSIHPNRVGYRRSHTLWWELEPLATTDRLTARLDWPNRFSRHLGDKAYGLLMADLVGLPVPRTTVIARRLAPFGFGRPTATGETWLRTCPTEQAPGRYSTVAQWTDPYALLAEEDPDGTAIAAVLAQQGVDPAWSGATMASTDGADFVQGVAGRGDSFMLGEQAPESLPAAVLADVRALAEAARQQLGPVRLEWVHDGSQAWVVQLHIARQFFAGASVVSAGEANRWLDFEVADGLDSLRELVGRAQAESAGIRIHGSVGLTSHVGDLLRRAGVPGRLADPEPS
jgi:hypothetical protein